ncbi:hypothetical protein [Demequina sp. NBRC 110054]|uniref:hypothetical protein n=1 Tax=Demequina sp. NBRC 110054 TaxID=1570343 RepID=UPI0009FE85BC|nr:hypothetical protein [Demequina sp. NBRC 110054]
MADALETTVNAGPTLSRRRIIQGAAWAAPAIVVATAVPAAALASDASGSATCVVEVNGSNVKFTFQSVSLAGFSSGDVVQVNASFNVLKKDGTADWPVSTVNNVNNDGWTVSSGWGTSNSVFSFSATYTFGSSPASPVLQVQMSDSAGAKEMVGRAASISIIGFESGSTTSKTLASYQPTIVKNA